MRFLFVAIAMLIMLPGSNIAGEPDLYSTICWEIAGPSDKITWIEIHNGKEAQSDGIAHVSVHARKKGDPIWELQWICPHIAITTEALKRSVLRPLKTRGAYPERYDAAYAKWKDDAKTGQAATCTTSVQEYLKQQK